MDERILQGRVPASVGWPVRRLNSRCQPLPSQCSGPKKRPGLLRAKTEGCLTQSVLLRQSRTNQSPVHSLQRSLVLPRTIENEHLSRQNVEANRLLIYKMRVIRPLYNSPVELATINS